METSAEDFVGLGAWKRESGTQLGRSLPLPEAAVLPFVIVSESHVIDVSTQWNPHAHLAHELLWVHNGTLSARVNGQIITISEGQGLWLPAGEVHGGRLTAKIELYSAFFSPGQGYDAFLEATVVLMTPVLESLLVHLARTDLDAAARRRAEAVVLDVLERSPHHSSLQLPNDDRVNAIAEELLENPADGGSLEEWALRTGTSSRTITRAFRTSTGLSFAQWRQSVRIHRAMELLASGHEVQDVAEVLGYAQPSTFIDAFHRTMGTTPGRFLDSSRNV